MSICIDSTHGTTAVDSGPVEHAHAHCYGERYGGYQPVDGLIPTEVTTGVSAAPKWCTIFALVLVNEFFLWFLADKVD